VEIAPASKHPEECIGLCFNTISFSIDREMNADVTEKVYANFGHSINQEEMELANTIIFK